uniref:PDZ domain-containing protein n=1 Tax=Desulfobacca acetoxidans TaxID=60893 RepID=A0A7C3Z198_9BACT
MKRFGFISVLVLICIILGGTRGVKAAKTTIPVASRYFANVEEAAQALQGILSQVQIVKMLPSESGGYEATPLPLQAFTLGPKTLTLHYKVPKIREGSGVIYSRPLPLHFSTQTSEEAAETKTFALSQIRLSQGIMAPDATDPSWSLWVVVPGGGGLPDITTLRTTSQGNAEVLYNALRSLMAAAGNPALAGERFPPTLSFVRTQPVREQPQSPRLGFSVTPAPSGSGLKITEIQPGGPAAQGGLMVGDVVSALNGRPVNDPGQLAAALQPQENLFTVLREGKTLKIRIITPVSF